MADEPITLEQFKDVCSRLFPDVPVEKAPPREPFPGKVIYDCLVDDTLHLRFCFADKYMDNHVVILWYEPPRRSPSWNVYVYTEERLLLELEAIVGARNLKGK